MADMVISLDWSNHLFAEPARPKYKFTLFQGFYARSELFAILCGNGGRVQKQQKFRTLHQPGADAPGW
jgi:hypothetical protein